MAWATAFRRNDEGELGWTAGLTLTARILAVNIFALALLAGGFFYLDSFRTQLIDQQMEQKADEVVAVAAAVGAAPPAARGPMAARIGNALDSRIRLYGRDGARQLDSFAFGPPAYVLRDPNTEPLQRRIARFLDRAIDTIVFADRPPPYAEPARDRLEAWPELRTARATGAERTMLRRAPDRTPMISAAMPLPDGTGVVLVTANARDIVRSVRAERFWLSIILLGTTILSVLLSLFLARTIARPLRRLALAAHRVRLGRAREVQVPRLPSRRDEIGTLARALSDMSQALRQKIDATEAFAADVTHELKNPLASLRSAVDSLDIVQQPDLRQRLVTVIKDDVHRLDRLITDIAEASRLDAEFARARFETIDLGLMIEGLIAAREARGQPENVRLAFARPHKGTAVVFGDGSRLARVFENLIDNAVSFSPPAGLVQVSATRDDEEVVIRVDDEGPGVSHEMRDAIFNRFHSIRPESEGFASHSGLGLAIAKAIVEGHNGTITVEDRDDRRSGARFLIRLPAAVR
ncbi:ATP-binding protein [Sphingomonas naphthae]|uniref:histidine kinase n=1 Tax=Sphingomonas naphthae TaxID=1813468 RepID=A0ABY7THN7_9SPHN|nr:ATP-binding protein [Sphingomonas naphthae]WCT71950.1 ATP-binding protein [Sphingomonas naphthae]